MSGRQGPGSLEGTWWQQHVAKQRDRDILKSMQICHMAGLRRVYNIRSNVKVTDQESQGNLDKEQDMELAGGSGIHYQMLESGAGLILGL